MNDISKDFGICLKSTDQRVLSQNDSCTKLCGNMLGKVCDKGCMANYKAPALPLSHLNAGMTLLKNTTVDDSPIDVVIINDGKTITSIIYSLEDKLDSVDQVNEELKRLGLTKSEVIIFSRVIMGEHNLQICQSLFISKATLKTHLNNIYKKLPGDWQRFKNRR